LYIQFEAGDFLEWASQARLVLVSVAVGHMSLGCFLAMLGSQTFVQSLEEGLSVLDYLASAPEPPPRNPRKCNTPFENLPTEYEESNTTKPHQGLEDVSLR
jgi:hypothetical protein